MNSIDIWIQNNIGLVILVYGLTFVAIGIAILFQSKKGSRFKLAGMPAVVCQFYEILEVRKIPI